MNKKAAVYFVSAFAAAVSAVFFLISRETPENEYVMTGEYDIWATESDTYGTSASYAAITTVTATETIPETIPETKAAATSVTEPQFVYLNINTASLEELMLLEGIGEVIGANIIKYRTAAGGFKNIEEIMNVDGIGEKTFLAIREHIYVESPVYYQTEPTAAETEISETDPPVQTEYVEVPVQTMPETTFYGRYDLNKVTLEELETIPGIDSELAQNIINLRTSIKYFSHPYELLYAVGMTEERLSEIIDYFYVGNDE